MDKVEADEENQNEADNSNIRINNSLPSPSVDSSSSASGEVVENVTLADTGLALGCITNDEENYDDPANANAGGGAERRSFLKSPTCTAILVVMMIASIAFVASIFIISPRLGQGSNNGNLSYVFRDEYNESNAAQIEMEDDTLSILMEDMIFSTSSINMEDTISPSPDLSPFQWYLPMEEQLGSGSPSVSPTQYPQQIALTLKVDEDTFNTTGETQQKEKDVGTYVGHLLFD